MGLVSSLFSFQFRSCFKIHSLVAHIPIMRIAWWTVFSNVNAHAKCASIWEQACCGIAWMHREGEKQLFSSTHSGPTAVDNTGFHSKADPAGIY